jgi:hypothetical protein
MPSRKPARKSGTYVKRTSRPPWKPERGQRVSIFGLFSVPEPLGFAIVIIVVILVAYLFLR